MLVRRSLRVSWPSRQVVCYFSDNRDKNEKNTKLGHGPSIRGEQTRGAMQDFMKSMAEKTDGKKSSPLARVMEQSLENRSEHRQSSDFDAEFAMMDREPRRRKRRGEEDDDFNSYDSDHDGFDDDLDEDDDGIDTETMRNTIIKKGYSFDTEELTSFEAYTARILEETLKSRDGTMTEVVEKPSFRRTRIPKARSTHTLMRSQVPKITSMKSGCMGHQLGEDVWKALNKNVYFSDYQRACMSNHAAAYAERLVAVPPKLQGPKIADKFHLTDLMNIKVFDPEFRKGYRYFTLEEEALQKAKGKRKVETYQEKAEVIFEEGAVTYLDEDELVLGKQGASTTAADKDDVKIYEREGNVKKDKKNKKK